MKINKNGRILTLDPNDVGAYGWNVSTGGLIRKVLVEINPALGLRRAQFRFAKPNTSGKRHWCTFGRTFADLPSAWRDACKQLDHDQLAIDVARSRNKALCHEIGLVHV